MTDQLMTPERRAEWRMAASGPSRGININSRVLIALLDAADERDRLLTVAHEADQLHAAALAAEGELLGDSPEMPRWERLLLNGLTLPELAKNVADERDRLLAVADTLGRVNGEYAMEIHRCREALGVDEDTDPHHAAQALAAAVGRVRALAEGWRYKGEFGWGAWQEGHGPDETGQALDYAAGLILHALDGADDEWREVPGVMEHGDKPCLIGASHPASEPCEYPCPATMPGYRCTRLEHVNGGHLWKMTDAEWDRLVAETAHAHLPITEAADGLTCDICGAELADWSAADEHVEQHEGRVG